MIVGDKSPSVVFMSPVVLPLDWFMERSDANDLVPLSMFAGGRIELILTACSESSLTAGKEKNSFALRRRNGEYTLPIPDPRFSPSYTTRQSRCQRSVGLNRIPHRIPPPADPFHCRQDRVPSRSPSAPSA